MVSSTKAHADKRVLFSAALAGSGIGLALGAIFMVVGMAQAVTDHTRAARIAETAGGSFNESVLKTNTAAMDPGVMRLARPLDPHEDNADSQRQVAALEARLIGNSALRLDRRLTSLDANRELDCLTQAVYFEARGETSRGQEAVAQVVMNRVASPAFPKSVCGVVYQGASGRGCQFSFACDGAVHARREAMAWSRARKIAARALSGVVLADIGGATHFHTTGVRPAWGPQMREVAQVGMHIFYRFGRPSAGQLRAGSEPHVVLIGMSAMDVPTPTIAPKLTPSVSKDAVTAEAAKPAPKTAADAAEPAPTVRPATTTKVTAADTAMTGAI